MDICILNRGRSGMSFIELIIYTAIVGFLLLAVVSFVLNAVQLRAKGHALAQIEYNGRLIETRLTDAARHATGLNVGASVFGTDPGTLSLTMADAAEDPLVFSLSADNGAFQVSTDDAAAAALTTPDVSVSELIFTNLTGADDAGLVRVAFTLTRLDASSPYHTYAESFQTTLRIPVSP